MSSSSDTQQILPADENRRGDDIEESDENYITLMNMVKSLPEGSSCSNTDNNGPEPNNSGAEDEIITCKLSSSSSCCRICQNGESSEELLDNSPCNCKGHLGKAHKSCLVQWVRYKGSNRCEICGVTFRNITPPSQLGVNQIEPEVEPPTENFYLEALEALRWQLARWRPLSRRKKSAMAGVIIFLTLLTVVTAILTVGADRDFQRVNSNPWATESEQEKAHMVFSVCISFLFFTGTLSIGLSMLWLVLECYYATQRRRILQDAAERMVAETRRERMVNEIRTRERILAEALRARLLADSMDAGVSNETLEPDEES